MVNRDIRVKGSFAPVFVSSIFSKLTPLALLAGWLAVHGLSALNSFCVAAVILVQVFTGVYSWKLLNRNLDITKPETLGMGLAIGSALATVSDQIFLTTPLKPIAWFIPSLIISYFAWRNPSHVAAKSNSVQTNQWIFTITASVILGNGEFLNGYGVALIMLIAGFFVSRLMSAKHQVTAYLATTCLILACLRLFRPVAEYGTWRLRALYTGTDDLVFSESLSNSISLFGLKDYIAAIDSPIRYHWFTLAWSGMTSRVSGSAPFDVTLHVVPVVAFLTISCLVWSIVFRLTTSAAASSITVIVLFATNSLPEQIRFFFVSNTSNTLSHIYLLASMLMFLRAIETLEWRWLIVFPSSLALTFLSKTPYAVVLLLATMSSLLFLFINSAKSRMYIVCLTFISFISTSLAYWLFLRPNSWEQRSFRLNLNPFNFQGLTYRTILATVVFVASIYAVRIPIAVSIFQTKPHEYLRSFFVFLGAGISAGLIRFVINGASAEQYFLNSALIFGAILTGCSIELLTRKILQNLQRSLLILYCAMTLLSCFLFSFVFTAERISRFPLGGNFLIVLPLLIGAISAVCFTLFTNRSFLNFNNFLRISIAVAFMGVSSGAYLKLSLEKRQYNFTESVASTTDLESLDWLRNTAEPTAVIATNRFLCIQEVPCSFDDSSFLISAVSRRRVLIEGPRFVIGGMPYPVWVKDRIQVSVDFANSPSYETWLQLRNLDVDWFYLDTNFITSELNPMNTPWNEWATVAYHNSNVYILKLKE